MQLRRATTADVPALGRVRSRAWRHAYAGVLPAEVLARMGPAREQARWRERLPRSGVWVAELDGQVIGYASEAPARRGFPAGFAGEIVELYLLPEVIGRGVGRALFDRACRSLAGQDFLWLVVDVLEVNASARRFYERRGLRADGTGWWDRWRGARLRVLRYAGPLNAALGPGVGRAESP